MPDFKAVVMNGLVVEILNTRGASRSIVKPHGKLARPRAEELQIVALGEEIDGVQVGVSRFNECSSGRNTRSRIGRRGSRHQSRIKLSCRNDAP